MLLIETLSAQDDHNAARMFMLRLQSYFFFTVGLEFEATIFREFSI